ncbi:hypothetical protein HDU77_001236 [Chytriomyces hyalinus]|nr:hypothetical protein HDU77_001236 [Chytriomyces hyalinus]
MDLDREKDAQLNRNPLTSSHLEPAWQPAMLPDPPSTSNRVSKHSRLPSISTLLEQLPPLSASSPVETNNQPISMLPQQHRNSSSIAPIPASSSGSNHREAVMIPSPIGPPRSGFSQTHLGHAQERHGSHRGGMHKKSYSMSSFDLHQIHQHQEQLRTEQGQQSSQHQLHNSYQQRHPPPQASPLQQPPSLPAYTVHYPPAPAPSNQSAQFQNSTNSDPMQLQKNHLHSNVAFQGMHKKTSSLDSNGSGSSDFGRHPIRSYPSRGHHSRSASHGGAGIPQNSHYLSSPHPSINSSPLLQGQQPFQPSPAQLANYRLQSTNEIQPLPPQSQPFARQPQQTPAPYVVDFRAPPKPLNQQQHHQQHQQQQQFHRPHQAVFHPPLPGTGRPRHVHHVRQASAPTIPSTVFINPMNPPASYSQPVPFQMHQPPVQRPTPQQLNEAPHNQMMYQQQQEHHEQQQQQQQPPLQVHINPTTIQPIQRRSYSPSSSNDNNGGSYGDECDDHEPVQLNMNGNPIKRRLRANRDQLRVLESVFEKNRTPSPAFKKDLAKKLNMPHKSILYWFQNRRAQIVRSQKQQSKNNSNAPKQECEMDGHAHQDDAEYNEYYDQQQQQEQEQGAGPSGFTGQNGTA